MSTINLFFYSNHCEGSKHLISLMESENLLRFFHKICTDNNPKVPPQIKVTPVLIIRGVAAPYVAGDAFAWLSKVKQWKINTLMNRVSTAQQQYLQNVNNNITSTTLDPNILGFSQAEMEGMSDFFAYIQKDEGVPHSYVACDEKDNIFTITLEDGTYKVKENSKYKINSTKQQELINKMTMERGKQDKLFKDNIDNFVKQYNKNVK
jgi:hypothetical protein